MTEGSEDRVQIDGQLEPNDGPVNGAPRRDRGAVHSWMRDLVISVVVSAFIIIFLYQPVRVEGDQHAAGAGGSGPVVHQQDGVSGGGDSTW